MSKKSLAGVFAGLAAAAAGIMMIGYPGESLAAAVRGLAVWWEVLFPSLFPFFVISELMLGFGVVHLFGTLLDPLMRPLFRIPGSGGFVAAMGYVSGYPVGARLTAKLYEERLITREEGERLVAFTTSSDPIFLLGAVAVGFFHDPSLGLLLAAAHYGSGLMIGLLMSLHGRKAAPSKPQAPPDGRRKASGGLAGSRPGRALAAMKEARRRDGRSLGELLQGAVASSLRLIIVVGGLVVFFNVLMTLLGRAGIMDTLFRLTGSLLSLAGFPQELSQAVVSGLFEVTLGASAAGSAAAVPPAFKAAGAAFILSWGGLSVHAQVVSILSGTGIRYWPFLAARSLHAVLAAGTALLLWQPLRETAVPAWLGAAAGWSGAGAAAAGLGLLSLLLGALLVLSALSCAIGVVFRSEID